MYLESDMLDLRPRVCFGSQAKSAFGTINLNQSRKQYDSN